MKNIKLKEMIKKSGLKQSYIASQIGISNNTLSSYIMGRRNPKIEIALKIARILKCNVEDIFFCKK